MKILLLAPHPFYQERGTPIAVDLLIKALSERGDEIDLLTFHEGADKLYPGVTIYRINPFINISGIKPGFSIKKIIADIFLFFRFIQMFFSKSYDVVHAVEESAFMAMLLCPLRGVPYIYDMDSSMTTQIVDKFPILKNIRSVIHFMESLPMRFAYAVVPMCQVLADDAQQHGAKKVVILKDVSLIKPANAEQKAIQIRSQTKIDGLIAMYIGNLESYQGIDLLLDSVPIVLQSVEDIHIVIIGGADSDIKKYTEKAATLSIQANVHFLGRQPVDQIGELMSQADILLSPRIHGVNTPMKVYSYLHSGVAVLATNLATHTQVMDESIGVLVAADAQNFAAGMMTLAGKPELRKQLAALAYEKMEKDHSFPAFKNTLYKLYQDLD